MRIVGAIVIGIGAVWIVGLWGLELIGALMRVHDGRLDWSGFTWHYSPLNVMSWVMRLIMGSPGIVAVIGGLVIYKWNDSEAKA
jgi:hypothetical protein